MANASDTGEWKCTLPVKGVNEGYVNESKLYNVSVVSCKDTHFFTFHFSHGGNGLSRNKAS